MRGVFVLGLPIGLTLVAETGMFTGANVLMGWFGAEPLAAHGIALQIAGLTGDRLPKSVAAAGRALAELVMPAPPPPHRRRAARTVRAEGTR